MTNRWELVQELFDATVALDAASRARVLARRVRGDAGLAAEVETLVAAAAAAPDALDRSAAELLGALRDEPPPEALCGATFGPYHVDAHVASGGMAHVYRATRRSAGTERRVALKVLRHGLGTDALVARFRRERETLASLEHEHVVAFIDAGALPDGRPYLVMEYVEGEPLVRWGRGVALRRRVELFLQVLAAVQYAHRALVVHRDLKPSNVLVTREGAPKLLDFGVATVLAGRASGGSHADARAPLTPAYASPEQLRGEPVTTASDVYALGALLRELVSADGVPSGGDLDAIARKALEPDAARRYRSADRMADDLRRWLAHEPVSARPGTWLYRAALGARRNRSALVLAGAVVAALAAGWVGAELDRRRAEREAGVGWGAHAQARAFAGVLERFVAAAALRDPRLAADGPPHLPRALEDDVAELPEAETLARLALAQLCLDAGELERAAEHAQRAAELAQTTRGVGAADRERAAELLQRVRAAREPIR